MGVGVGATVGVGVGMGVGVGLGTGLGVGVGRGEGVGVGAEVGVGSACEQAAANDTSRRLAASPAIHRHVTLIVMSLTETSRPEPAVPRRLCALLLPFSPPQGYN